MGILQPPLPISANTGVIPNIKTMCTTDNLATITTAGYLNNLNLGGYPVSATDILNIEYSFNTATQTGTFGFFTVGINNGVITLTEYQSASGVNATLPTAENAISVFSNTTGDIKQGLGTVYNDGPLQSGRNGVAGNFRGYPAGVSSGFLSLQPANNAGNFSVVLTNASYGQSSTLTIPDPGAASSSFMLTNGTTTMNTDSQIIFGKGNGTESSNAVTTTGNSGVITTSALGLTVGTSYSIIWTNTRISTSSVILVSVMGGTNTVRGATLQATALSGSSNLVITNSGPSPFNGTILIGYLIA